MTEHEQEHDKGQDLPVTPLVMPDGTHQGYVRGDGRVALFTSPVEKALRGKLRQQSQEVERLRALLSALVEASEQMLWELIEAAEVMNITIVNMEKTTDAAKQALQAPLAPEQT